MPVTTDTLYRERTNIHATCIMHIVQNCPKLTVLESGDIGVNFSFLCNMTCLDSDAM